MAAVVATVRCVPPPPPGGGGSEREKETERETDNRGGKEVENRTECIKL